MTAKVEIRDRIKELRRVPASELVANPKNWRRHPKAQRQAMTGLLREVGYAGALLAYETPDGLRLIDGHLRREVTPDAIVPVLILDVTEEEADLLLATYDPIGAMAEAAQDVLARLMGEVGSGDAALTALLENIARTNKIVLDGGAPEDPGPQLDRAEELREKWQTERGQIWEIPSLTTPGKAHRLICGDSTSVEDVEGLMAGEMARLFATDPPYGVDYVKNAQQRGRLAVPWQDIEGDDQTGEAIQPFLESAFTAWLPHLCDNAAWYLWHGMLTQAFFAAAAAAAGLLLHRQIIWVKPHLIIGRGDYHWRHELCFYGWRRGNRPPFYGERNQTSVWDIGYNGNRNSNEHPTQKPVELWYAPMRNHLLMGEIAAEPFCGSGTQLIAAEQLGRLCYGMEIHPPYVAVALERMAGMGLQPRLT